MKFNSIRSRLQVANTLFITALLVVIATGTYLYFRHTTRELIFEQQFTLVTSSAHTLDHKISETHDTLISVAKNAPQKITENSSAAQAWLNNRPVLQKIFSGSLYILDTEGGMLASYPPKPELYGLSFVGRDYFKNTISSGKPVISMPYVTVSSKQPAISMTAPLRNRKGEISGILCGRIDLLATGTLFASLKDVRLGSNGYLYLFAPDRTMIMHPDPSRVMKQDVKPGVNKMFDQALAGFEGSGETVNSKGRHYLASFKRLKTTGWILAANYPSSEAYLPITNFRNYYLLGMVIVLVSAVALVRRIGLSISNPLTEFTENIQELTRSGSETTLRLDAARNDELGLLAGAFNNLLDELQRDNTMRRNAEAARSKLSRAIEQSPVTTVITDIEGRIEFVNPIFSELTGYSVEEALGQNPRILKSDRTPRETYEQLWGAISAGNTWEGEFLNKKKNGELFWEHAIISALRDTSGVITHYLAVKENITEKKKMLEELTAARDKAEAATRAKSAFLATMSHEIRTPMNGVIGMTSLLLDTELTAEQRDFAEIVRKSGENLLTLINEILDFSKIEAGKMELEILDFDLRPTLEDTAELLSLRAVEKGLELICRIDPAVPSFLKGDPGRLRQVITNLTGNAIKFTHEGEIVISATLAAEDSDGVTILFKIQDTGIGIPPDRLDAVFAPFTQVDGSTTRKYGGTGLGLTICRQLTEMMGGEIGVTSEAGSGSTFWFTCRFEQQRVNPGNPLHTNRVTEAELKGLRILVVEGNATNRQLISTLLEHWGCRHSEAVDGMNALAMLQEAVHQGDPFQLVIVAQEGGGQDGLETGRRIKADPLLATTRMIMVTSLGLRGDAALLDRIGFDGYLTKPVRQSQLHDCISLVIGRISLSGLTTGQSSPGIVTRHTVAESHKRTRVLLVEDNIINQKVAQNMLGRLGYRTDVVANGLEAVRALELIDYGLVLMDCLMPDMDGYEATAMIRASGSNVLNHSVPIIAMTANALQEDRDICLAAGMNDYLSKPIYMEQLTEILGKWLPGEGPVVLKEHD